jgi:hypothetical protein
MNFHGVRDLTVAHQRRSACAAGVLAVALVLCGCAGRVDPKLRDPTLDEWQAADFGSPPASYDAAIRAYLEDALHEADPTSLTPSGGPHRTWIGTAPNFQFGYGICLQIKEHNIYDPQTDMGATFFFLQNGVVTQMRQGSEGERLCDRLGRSPVKKDVEQAD